MPNPRLCAWLCLSCVCYNVSPNKMGGKKRAALAVSETNEYRYEEKTTRYTTRQTTKTTTGSGLLLSAFQHGYSTKIHLSHLLLLLLLSPFHHSPLFT